MKHCFTALFCIKIELISLSVIAMSGQTKVREIRDELGMSSTSFSVYRERLKRKGVINTAQYGHVCLSLPRLDTFIKMRME
jgi:predicted transcriptional regulator